MSLMRCLKDVVVVNMSLIGYLACTDAVFGQVGFGWETERGDEGKKNTSSCV